MKGTGACTRRNHCVASAWLDRGFFQNCEDILSGTISTKGLYKLFYRTCQGIGGAILPRRCVVCQAGLQNTEKHGLSSFICTNCTRFIDNHNSVRCKRCGLSLGPRLQAFGWTHCRHCKPILAELPSNPLDCVVCSDYVAPFDQWIALLKYGNNHGLAQFMGTWLGITALEAHVKLPDVLIPVPCSVNKLRQRGYNQAALIARHLGKHIQRPVNNKLLIKNRETGAQADLGRAERLKNLQETFQATELVPKGLRVGLVDDVITTGATIESCVSALRKAGAESIVTLAICRTPE